MLMTSLGQSMRKQWSNGAGFLRGRRGSSNKARYWRVYITANNGDVNYTEITNLEFYENWQSGIAPLTGTANALTQFNASFGPDKLFDGNTTTSWISSTGSGFPQWVGYDFGVGAAVNVNTIYVTGSSSNPNGCPRDFAVQYSNDGSVWTTAWSVTGATSWGGLERRGYYDPLILPNYTNPKRMWRVNATTNATSGNVVELNELRFNTAPSTPAALTGTAIASSAFGGSVAANAFDANVTTFWSSLPGLPQWVGYDFGAGNSPDIVQILINMAGTRAPKDFTIDYSGDGLRWTTAWSHYDLDYWPGGDRLLNKPANPGAANRRWRINITNTPNGGISPELAELRFYRAGAVQAPLNYQFFKSNQFGASVVDNLFDGISSTLWTSSGNAPQFVGYDFGTGEDIVRVDMTAGVDTGRPPRDFDVQYSQDGIAWVTAWSVTGQIGWSANETRSFTKP